MLLSSETVVRRASACRLLAYPRSCQAGAIGDPGGNLGLEADSHHLCQLDHGSRQDGDAVTPPPCRPFTPGCASSAKDGEVELAQAGRVGERGDGDDLAIRDGHA